MADKKVENKTEELEDITVEESGADAIDTENGETDDTGNVSEEEVNTDEDDESEAPKKGKKSREQEKIEELTDRVKRQMAEFDNFRKRTEKEKSQMFEMGASDILEKLLPVVDNFERGLDALGEDEKNAFSEGMEKIYKQLMTMLDDVGVEQIEAEGAEFDPELHNAVMHVDDESLGENVVAEELQKGYRYKNTVLRHSMVKVAN